MRSGWRGCYLDLLERVGHHCNEHVNEDDDSHRVIAQQHVLGDALSEILDLSFAHGAELRQPEQRPEERHVTFPQAAAVRQTATHITSSLLSEVNA